MQPKVSTVITCYNYGRFLAAAVESALAQTYANLDVVVIDDGSTDDTRHVIEPYLRDCRVRYIRQENRGQAAAKNLGIHSTDGELVAFLDADDVWEPRKLEKQVPLFERAEVGLVYSGVSMIDESGAPLPFEGFQGYLSPRSGRVTEWLVFDNIVPFSSSVVRRTCLNACGGFDESLKMGIDWDLWLRVSLHNEFAVVNEPLLKYRVGHAGQMSKRTDERFKAADGILRRFLDEHPGAIPPRILSRADAYTCVVRSSHYRNDRWLHSTALLMKALRHDWSFVPAYRGLLKNLLFLLPGHDRFGVSNDDTRDRVPR